MAGAWLPHILIDRQGSSHLPYQTAFIANISVSFEHPTSSVFGECTLAIKYLTLSPPVSKPLASLTVATTSLCGPTCSLLLHLPPYAFFHLGRYPNSDSWTSPSIIGAVATPRTFLTPRTIADCTLTPPVEAPTNLESLNLARSFHIVWHKRVQAF